MGWRVLIDVALVHDYYTPNTPPLTVRPCDPRLFEGAGLILRRSAGHILVLAEDGNTSLPETIKLDLHVQNSDVIAVTKGGDWSNVPQIELREGIERATLNDALPSKVPQEMGKMRLAQVSVALNSETKREITVHFAAMSSHWAYHVIGPGHDDVQIGDQEGEVLFDAMGIVTLPDGNSAHVLRSRDALPASARPAQRFSLSRPGPFGSQTLIPVLPAPQPRFAEVPAPDRAGVLIQSDIYVSIF